MNQRSTDFGYQRQAEFALYLRALRKYRKLRQNYVANELGISASELCFIEKGNRRAGDQLLVEMARIYRVPLEEILRKKYWPQLPLLEGIMRPAELMRDIRRDIGPQEIEEVTRYIALLLLKSVKASVS